MPEDAPVTTATDPAVGGGSVIPGEPKHPLTPKHMIHRILGRSLGLQSGVSPSRVSPGGAWRLKRACLSVDVLLDDGQWCASAGDGEVRTATRGVRACGRGH